MGQKVLDDELIATMKKQKSRKLGKLIPGALILVGVEGTGSTLSEGQKNSPPLSCKLAGKGYRCFS